MERAQAKRHRKNKGSNKEEERTNKKPKGPKKEEEMTKQHKGDEALILKGDEVIAKLRGGVGSKLEGGKTKLVTVRSPLPLEDHLIDELIAYMVSEPLAAHTECGPLADAVLNEYINASLYELYKLRREFNANVIQQYRINGYADIRLEVNDDEEEEEVNDDELEGCCGS